MRLQRCINKLSQLSSDLDEVIAQLNAKHADVEPVEKCRMYIENSLHDLRAATQAITPANLDAILGALKDDTPEE